MTLLAGTTGTWTPVCMARADLIGWDPEVSQKLTKQMRSGIVHHKSDRKSCVIPTADRNNILTDYGHNGKIHSLKSKKK